MMRRFTRRRRGGSRSGAAPIEAKSVFEKILEQGIVPAESLEAMEAEEIPADLAVLGTGKAKSGGRLLVAFSPRDASHAVLAALAVGKRLAEAENFDGDFHVVAPGWTGSGRRLLSAVGELPFRLNPVAASSLAVEGEGVASELIGSAAAVTPVQIAGHLAGPVDRDLFLRASRSLEGLAAKHAGALRGHGRGLEFTLLAKCVAELRATESGVDLVTILPQRSTIRLTPENLSGTLDGLEGQLRKRLNDRRTREGEDGMRTRAILAFRTWHSLRSMVPWPLGGRDGEVIDWIGVDVEGRPVVGAVREKLSLAGLGVVLDAFLQVQPSLPSVLSHAAPPVVLDAPRLVVGGREIATGVQRVLDALALSHELFEIRGRRDGDLELREVAAGQAPARERPPRQRAQRRSSSSRVEAGESAAAQGPAEPETAEQETATEDASQPSPSRESGTATSERSRGRRRSRRGRGRREGSSREPSDGAREVAGDEGDSAKPAMRFDEVSLFDLDDEPSDREGGGSNRPRGRARGRGRRRGRTGASEGGQSSGSSEETLASSSEAPEEPPERPRATREAGDPDAESLEDAFLDDEGAVELAEVEDIPEFEAPTAPRYEDEEEGERDTEEDDRSLERERLRQTRRGVPSQAPVEVPKLPRQRSAIVAHADRDSLVAAILLARDIRAVEGIWIYPQSELMTFFRAVTTDLRADTPIYVVGFTPSPAPDVLQAASLYPDRIAWFDHHEWPPEDLQALRDVIGADSVHVVPGAGSTLPPVLELCSRRSRFSDKLVDLVSGRFSLHDYERWGRVWWSRLGETSQKTGDRRIDVEALLSGRPSDLAEEAARADTPPIPTEVEYVSQRDFRLVHFAGYGLVVVEVPPELDLHLTARVVRERYGASLSLAYRPASEHVVFAGDELAGRRSLDLGSLVEHICNKLEWVEQLSDTDHIARVRIRDWAAHPERLDDIVAEIAMGRSILER